MASTAALCMQDMGEVEIDFPFRVSPSEQAIIESDPDPADAFPLFWTTKQFLRAVDATLAPTPLSDGPFFPRYAVLLKSCTSLRVM